MMKKTVIAVLVAAAGISAFQMRGKEEVETTESGTKVYICTGPYSKRYHYKSNCRGLKSCSTDIYAVSLEEARKRNRTLCGFED